MDRPVARMAVKDKTHGRAEMGLDPIRAVLGPIVFAALLAFTISLTASSYDLTLFYLARQDRWLLLAGVGILLASTCGLKGAAPLAIGNYAPLAVGGAMFILCLIGHYAILAGYDLSRDEQMATFDAAIFAQGRLVQPLPAFWRDHSAALNTTFIVPAEQRAAWVSAYLPGNAALRAIAGTFAAPALVGPVMTAIGAVALWASAARIWPDDREARIVALTLYLGSAQVLVTGMTAYAMPAHLACNLAWLWLFLRRAWWADIAALLVAFVAVGLHQPLMHPLFAAPLLFLLVMCKQEWPRAILFALGYAVIGLFWLSWPEWTWNLAQAATDARQPAGVDYLTRLTTTVQQLDAAGLINMIANLLRFAAWQHLLLLPLVLAGMRIARHDRLAGALAAGVILTIVVMTVILPYQGHGFGYRYLHGLIGNCIILAVYGWRSMVTGRSRWRPILIRSSLAGLALLLPLQLWMAHAFYRPAAMASRSIAAIHADYAVIGGDDAPFSADLVYNPSELDRQPLRLLREAIEPELIEAMCLDGSSVAIVGRTALEPIANYFGVAVSPGSAHANRAIGRQFAQAGCTVSYRD